MTFWTDMGNNIYSGSWWGDLIYFNKTSTKYAQVTWLWLQVESTSHNIKRPIFLVFSILSWSPYSFVNGFGTALGMGFKTLPTVFRNLYSVQEIYQAFALVLITLCYFHIKYDNASKLTQLFIRFLSKAQFGLRYAFTFLTTTQRGRHQSKKSQRKNHLS